MRGSESYTRVRLGVKTMRLDYCACMAFPAKYGGTCVACGQRFDPGEMIETVFGRGYAHTGHDSLAKAAGVTQSRLAKEDRATRPGIRKVPDGSVGQCERCRASAVVYTVKVKSRRMQVCSTCHTALVVPGR